MALGPSYRGVSVTSGGETERITHTLIEANGLWVLWLLLVPVVLSGLALLTLRFTSVGQIRRKLLLWASAIVLLALCAVSIFSIGVFYLWSAVGLLIAGVSDSFGRQR